MVRVPLVVHYEEGTWWADSPALKGLTVVAGTLGELRVLAREGAAFHLETDEEIVLLESMSIATQPETRPDATASATQSMQFTVHRPAVRLMAPA